MTKLSVVTFGTLGIFVRQASAASGLVTKVLNSNFSIFKSFLCLPGAPKFQSNLTEIWSKMIAAFWIYLQNTEILFHPITRDYGLYPGSFDDEPLVIALFAYTTSKEIKIGGFICDNCTLIYLAYEHFFSKRTYSCFLKFLMLDIACNLTCPVIEL